ncbi:primosomal protein N' [candidate division CSSED10-310 bacterium]|uniref:Replication restart protein PriA n=1 Tax=candidate division CSSED10-310 bacterium TaxID=2855610 RepID=A0ABV6YXL3_UNCC1
MGSTSQVNSDLNRAPFLEVDVVFLRPLEGVFTYVVSAPIGRLLKQGCPVLVPLSRVFTVAYVVHISDRQIQGPTALKTIKEILDFEPVINHELLELTKKVAHYYHSQWGWVLKNALPPGITPQEVKQIVVTTKGREVTLTEMKGKEGAVANILRLLKGARKPHSYTDLVRAMKKDHISLSIIKSMEKNGLVELIYTIPEQKEKRTQGFYRLADVEISQQLLANTSPQKAPKKAAVMELIMKLSQELTLFSARDLNNRLPVASRYLQVLVKENFISPVSQVDETAQCFINHNKKEIARLMPQQQVALEVIERTLPGEFMVFLLHGVTGSGKTEVYLRCAEKVLAQGKDVLLLVPEIGLTPAMIALIKNRFKDRTALLHSGLEKGERLKQWRRAREDSPKVVLGTRSAVFAPLKKPGLIIVDEEHDSSFKQNNAPMYNARDVAVLRGYYNSCPVILGSATPAMESYYNAHWKKYKSITMSDRVDQLPLPPVHIIDMRKKRKERRSAIISNELLHEIEHCLRAKEQVILFIPRRGFSNFIMCHACGYIPHCDQCSVSLTYHRLGERLKCHYCDQTIPKFKHCPECDSDELRGIGLGTQSVELEIKELFPQAQVARLDTDTTRGKQIYILLRDLAQGKIDILIGTQMVTKGHDFKNITLVGVISADTSLYLPDFRAAERTFQMLTQVAGRTGRGKRGGKVIVQTHNPDHHCIIYAAQHDYKLFYDKEIKFRKSFHFPPFRRIANIMISGTNQGRVIKAVKTLRNTLNEHPPEIELLGPAPAPIARLKNRYRWQIIVKGVQSKVLGDFISQKITWFSKNFKKQGLHISVDIDPLSML